MSSATQSSKATVGGGCFWCLEALFQRLQGVTSVVPGYAGGHVPNPSYEQVCTSQTGHAEVVQITFNPDVISYAELLDVFFHAHDPTTLSRQGHDVGPQYRSIILHHDEEQKQTAEEVKQRLDDAGEFADPIVTEIVPLEQFYPAEDYHRDYFRRNPAQGYCRFVIVPKLETFRSQYGDRLNDG